MGLFCLCLAQTIESRADEFCENAPTKIALPKVRMECINTGTEVYLNGHRQFPNVDVFECPTCKARVAK